MVILFYFQSLLSQVCVRGSRQETFKSLVRTQTTIMKQRCLHLWRALEGMWKVLISALERKGPQLPNGWAVTEKVLDSLGVKQVVDFNFKTFVLLPFNFLSNMR